ncbi:hypothetical protein L4D76_00485 [Photobacterium sagamiensis]
MILHGRAWGAGMAWQVPFLASLPGIIQHLAEPGKAHRAIVARAVFSF